MSTCNAFLMPSCSRLARFKGQRIGQYRMGTKVSFFRTRLALTGMVVLFMDIEKRLGKDYL